jgi:large subunit ribosomal protein L10
LAGKGLKDHFQADVLDLLFSLRLKGGFLSLNRQEKEKRVDWLNEQFRGVKALFLTNFQGLSVAEMNALRSELRDRGINYKVMKNTLVRLAYQDTDVATLGSDFVGPRAAAWTEASDNVPAMAKVLVDFAKAHPNLTLIRGVLDGKLVEPTDMEALSTLPPREELLARVLGTMKAPVTAFVNTLAAVPRSLLTVLKAIEEQKSSSSESATA